MVAAKSAKTESTNVKKKQVIFSKAGKGETEAYYLFGEVAEQMASIIELPLGSSKKSQPMLKVVATEFDAVKVKLEKSGYAIAISDAASKPIAELRLFEGKERSGTNIFGDAAKVVADALNIQVGTTRKNEFYLTLELEQIPAAEKALEDAGYDPKQLKEATVIKSPGRFCLLKEAAAIASDYFGVEVEMSQAGNAKLNLAPKQYQEIRPILKLKGYYTKEIASKSLDRNKSETENK